METADRRKLGKQSARKGKEAEREVAAVLQEWWRQLEPKCEFARTPQSGGWATFRLRKSFRTFGDVMSNAAQWPFVVESKKRGDVVLWRVLAGRLSRVWGFWDIVCDEARKAKRAPLLLFYEPHVKEWYTVVRDTGTAVIVGAKTVRPPVCKATGRARGAVQVLKLEDMVKTLPALWVPS